MLVPRPDSRHPLPSIESVLNLALSYNPSLAAKDISEVYFWIESGASVEQDIVPVMKQITEKKKDISLFRYFRRPILEAMHKRLITPKVESATKPQTQEERDYQRAKSMAWCRARGINTTRTDYDWLERYERIHGQVTP